MHAISLSFWYIYIFFFLWIIIECSDTGICDTAYIMQIMKRGNWVIIPFIPLMSNAVCDKRTCYSEVLYIMNNTSLIHVWLRFCCTDKYSYNSFSSHFMNIELSYHYTDAYIANTQILLDLTVNHVIVLHFRYIFHRFMHEPVYLQLILYKLPHGRPCA